MHASQKPPHLESESSDGVCLSEHQGENMRGRRERGNGRREKGFGAERLDEEEEG